VAGRIDGVVDGRPVSLDAERQRLILAVGDWRTLWKIHRNSKLFERMLFIILKRSNLSLIVRLRWFGSFELHPNPSFLVRRFLPLG
jgi:hypothetical protein